jgi:regulator of protease activity HflC (stomatin/prohibitin superfamily)
MTGALLMDRDLLMELVDQLRLNIPQEVRSAEQVLFQKDEIINNAMLEARRARVKAEDEFREKLGQNELRKRAEDMLQEAERRANRLVEQAEAECAAKRTEADAYALRSLRAFERELQTLNNSVRKGIDMLAGNALVGAVSVAPTASEED